ncbi:hypothetical protein [Arthrobacter sp. 92]|uniref:hypothetical protein n=1 Tax=Arthrobacter sp. 92 TaxID=3418175 RepID=UPI003D07637B
MFSASVVSSSTPGDIGLWRNHWTDPTETEEHAAGFLRELLTASDNAATAASRWSQAAGRHAVIAGLPPDKRPLPTIAGMTSS